MNRTWICLALWTVLACGSTWVQAATLHLGALTVDITPEKPVALDGHRAMRISTKAETPMQANILALESREGDQVVDQAVMVSVDIVAIRDGILDKVRNKIGDRIPGLDLQKIFLNATHTHAGPVTTDGKYAVPEDGSVQLPSEYAEWMTGRIADGVVEVWGKREPGVKVAWGLGSAVIAQNRRPYYADGTAVMYGKTNVPEFRGIEGYEDHNVDILYFWNSKDEMVATVINLPCPSQEVGGRVLSADFWHPVRQQLKEKHGQQLHVLAWCGAGGDVTSRPVYQQAAEERMRKLRGNLSRLDEMARRIVHAWEDTLEAARYDIRDNVVFRHTSEVIDLPYRKVTREEYETALSEAEKYANDPAQRWNYGWNQRVVDRYNAQQVGTQPPYQMELHAMRIGDVAVVTNSFELYTDFGTQIKARSPAIQTFVVQLAGPGSYLPTERAAKHGGYGAVIQSSQIGPDGGQVLVEKSIEAINRLWAE